ncbi:DUF1588 domain-containing protein [bacterium]|jgi:hypothetical protein|nr:DUF1588 domain-containing protein [bacterium]
MVSIIHPSKKEPFVSHLICLLVGSMIFVTLPSVEALDERAAKNLETYCFDCHDDISQKGDLNLIGLLDRGDFDGTLLFENLITGKMPPADKKQPSTEERRIVLDWLAARQRESAPDSFRRLSRFEFVHSVNDLLGTDLDLAKQIPEDRGTYDFDSDRKIKLSREMLGAYFKVADEMLDFAFPVEGFPAQQVWVTNKVKDSHHSYNIYLRPYEEGILFSWTRANNGNNYSFFYDDFDPLVSGWYDLTFDAMKVADFEEDVSLQVYSGKYYYADDRPQSQRLLDVISLGNREMKSHSIRVFLNPGEIVSVHCYSKYTFRKQNPEQGAYVKQLKVRGPVFDEWPPTSYQKVFDELPLMASPRQIIERPGFQTNLQKIGGHLSVSSFQEGMEKGKMQDGSNRTFWHTQFKPTEVEPPHYVILENPHGVGIEGLSYAAWSGGNGNGQVKGYAIYRSDDGELWDEPFVKGELEVRLANEQPILFPEKINSRFIKFLVTDALSLDGKSLASIGKLDVLTSIDDEISRASITVSSSSFDDLKRVIRRFAEKAFSSDLSEEELTPYFSVSHGSFKKHGDFVRATKAGLKAILCSPRFLMAPGEHANPSYSKAAALARMLWLSVPDEELLRLSKTEKLSDEALQVVIDQMLRDERSQRMIHSFCDQWLNLRSLDKVTPSLKLYPEYNDLLNHYLPIETRRYLNHLIQENQPVGLLIDSDFSFLNQRLAQHYGIEGIIGQEMRQVSFSPEVPRGGLLTMGSVLKVTTDGYDTSPILRGAWVSKNIVGTPLSPPPPNVSAIEPEHGEATTLREQIEQHKSSKTCYACHKSIDPYGFGLESFDATGHWRERYRVKKDHNATFIYRLKGYYSLGGDVDASGEINKNPFDNVFGLKKVLLSDPLKIAYNFAKKFFEYANGYKPSLKQRLELFELVPADPEDCRMKDLVTEVLIYSLTAETE